MSSDLTPDQSLRAVAALKTASAEDDAALAVLMRGGQGEQPLAVPVTQYGASRFRTCS